jgi:hypothetical protein
VTSPTHRSEPHPAIWPDRPMPDAERRLLTTLSAGVWLIALAMNVSHVYDHLGQAGIRIDDTRRAVLCLAPDVLLLIGVWKLRYRARSAVAWAMVGTGLAWLAWSALSTAHGTLSAGLLAVAPIGVAVLTTLALEFKHVEEPEPAPTPSGTGSNLGVEPAAATELEPSMPTFKPEAVLVEPPRQAAPKASVKGCPTREAARQILLDLDPVAFETTSNAELGRLHGGSDNWWGQRRREVADELAKIGGQA